jgi:PAS domain S-box-containing protein
VPPDIDADFQVMLDSVVDYAILKLDPVGRVATWNKGAERIKGYRADEILGNHFSRFYPPEEIALGRPDAALLTAAGTGRFEDEGWRVRKDGSRFWAHVVITTLREERGEIRGFVKVTRDKTESRRAETALRDLHANLEGLVEARTAELDRFFALSLDMLCIASMDGYLTRVSPAFTETLGWSTDELLARPFLDFVHADDRAATLVEMEKLSRGVPVIRFENRYLCQDGSWRWLSWKTQPIVAERLLYATARDVTEHRTTEAALRSSEARYRTLFSSIDQGFCIVEVMFDQHGTPQDYRFLEVSPSFERQTGLRDAVGRTMRDVAGAHEQYWVDLYGRVALTGEATRVQNRAEALERWYDVFAFRVGAPENRHVGILFDDITERTRSAETVAQLNADLERGAAHLAQANKELEAFSYSVSHDLRAPLRHVQGYAEMLQRATAGQLSEKAGRYLQTITAATVEMGRLIDDLLAFSRMARAEMHAGFLDLNPIVREVVMRAEQTAAGRPIEWRIATLPAVVGDADLLKQVIANLVDNAVKYSRQREVAIIEIGHLGEEDGREILFVRDNGAGFDMRYVHKLFGVFQRLHRTDEFEGTGIGLATVQRVVARHGGRVWAEGAVDRGATFYVALKRASSVPE